MKAIKKFTSVILIFTLLLSTVNVAFAAENEKTTTENQGAYSEQDYKDGYHAGKDLHNMQENNFTIVEAKNISGEQKRIRILFNYLTCLDGDISNYLFAYSTKDIPDVDLDKNYICAQSLKAVNAIDIADKKYSFEYDIYFSDNLSSSGIIAITKNGLEEFVTNSEGNTLRSNAVDKNGSSFCYVPYSFENIIQSEETEIQQPKNEIINDSVVETKKSQNKSNNLFNVMRTFFSSAQLPELEAPSNIHITSSTTSSGIDIAWDEVQNAVSYSVQINEDTIVNTTATNYTITGLAANTAHTVRVRTNSGASNGEWSSAYNFNIVSGEISGNVLWEPNGIYIVANNITVNNGSALTISAGAKVYIVGSDISITVNGTLNINGQQDSNVLLSSINDPDLGGEGKTYWKNIIIGTSGSVNAAYLTMKYGKITANGDLNLTNSLVSNSSDYGISLNMTSVSDINIKDNTILATLYVKNDGYNSFAVEDNVVTNSSGYPIHINMTSTSDIGVICNMLYNNNSLIENKYNFILLDGALSANHILPGDIDYSIDSVTINSTRTLTISKGANIYINGHISVYGTLNIEGEQDNDVLITSIEDPDIGGSGTIYSENITTFAPGRINADYLALKYIKIVSNGSLNLTNSIVSDCYQYGISIETSTLSDINVKNNTILSCVYVQNNGYNSFVFEGNTITNSTGFPIYINMESASNVNTICQLLAANNTLSGNAYNFLSIGGTVTTVQTLPGNMDYGLAADLIINSNAALTISQGARFFVSSVYYEIIVNGTLNINGAQSNNVVVTRLDSPAMLQAGSYWEGIKIGTSGSLNAQYLTLGYGKIVANGSLNLTGSNISNSNGYAISLNLTSQESNIRISNNTILNNIYIKNNTYNSLVIAGNTITESTGYPVYLDMGSTSNINTVCEELIDNNTFTGSQYNFISIGGTITAGHTLPGNVNYGIVSNLTINSGAELTVSENSNILVTESCKIAVNGTLSVNGGTQGNVTVTSISDPAFGGTAAENWQGITIGATGSFNAQYLTLKYGKIIANGDLNLTNSNISSFSGYVISLNLTSVSDINIKNNTILAAVYIKNDGFNSLVVEDNTINNGAGYPIYIDMSGSSDDDIYAYLCENNEFSEDIRKIISIGGTINTDKTLSGSLDYYVTSNLVINSSATLKIPGGANVYVVGTYKITVNGVLNIEGSINNKVLITSINDTQLGGTGNTYWGGIIINANGAVNASYLTLHYGKINANGNLSVQNSEIAKTNTYGLSLVLTPASEVNVSNNTILSTVYIKNSGYEAFVMEDNIITKETGYPVYIDLASPVFSKEFLQYLYDENNFTGCLFNEISMGGTIGVNTTIPYIQGKKYGVPLDIVVPQNLTLTIEPGAILLVGDGYVDITVKGTLVSEASAQRKTVITYYKDTNYGGSGFTFNYYARTWNGIDITSTGSASLKHTDVLYYVNSDCAGNLSAENASFLAVSSAWSVAAVQKEITFNNCEIASIQPNLLLNIDDSKCVITENKFVRKDGELGLCGIKITKTANIDGRYFSIENNEFDMTLEGLAEYFPVRINLNNFDDALFEKITDNETVIENEASPVNIIALDGCSLTADKTLNNKFDTYVFLSDVTIAEGITLDVEPGILLGMYQNKISVYGTLNLNGTYEDRITILPYYYLDWSRLEYTTKGGGYWRGIKIYSTGTVLSLCTDIASYDHSDLVKRNVFTVNGRLNMLGSSIFYSNMFGHDTYGTFIIFDTDITPEIHYNCFTSAYGTSDYKGRIERGDAAFINERADQMVIDMADNYWGSDEGPSVDGSTVGFLISQGFNLDSNILDKMNFGQSGISSASGNFSATNTDLKVTCPGFTIDFTRTYNSRSQDSRSFSRGWTLNIESKAMVYSYSANGAKEEFVLLSLPDGSVVSFTKADGVYTSDNCRHSLTKNSSNQYVLTTKDAFIYTYNAQGNLISIKDKNGNTITIEVDEQGRVRSILDSLGRMYVIQYNAVDQIYKIRDFNNNEIEYVYTQGGNLQKVLDYTGKTIQSYEYNQQGFVTAIKNGAGEIQESISYYENSNINRTKVQSHTDSYGKTVNYSYDTVNRVTTMTDQNNNVTKDYYDENYFIVKRVDEEQKAMDIEYHNTFGDIKSVTDRNGNKTEYFIDAGGNIIKIQNPDLSYSEMTYDSNNNVIGQKDENGNKSYYQYDAKNNLIKKIQPLDGVSAYTAQSNDNNFAITSYAYYTDQEAQSLGYGGKGLLKSETDPNGTVVRYEYDSNGYAGKKAIEGTGSVITYQNNSYGQCLQETTAEGVVTQYDYDKCGNLLRETKSGNQVTRYVYDSANRLVQKIAPNQYDSTKDGLNNLIKTNEYEDTASGERYSYNASGDIIVSTNSVGAVTTLTYDQSGNVVLYKLPTGGEYLFEYDALNRSTKQSYRNTTASEPVVLEEYAYEILEDKTTQVTVKKYSDAQTYTTTVQTFNHANKLIKSVEPDSGVGTIAYNPNGTISAASKGDYQEKYAYDGLNREIKKWVSADNSGPACAYIYSEKSYDKGGRVISESIGKSYVGLNETPADLLTYTYTYSKLGQVTSVSDNDGLLSEYAYNDDGNPVTEEKYINSAEKLVTEYTYTGNFITEKLQNLCKGDIYPNSYTDTQVQELSESYTYDLNGNIKTVTNANGTVFTGIYDNLNRLTDETVDYTDENGNAIEIALRYLYTPDGQINAEMDANGKIKGYIYNNKGLLEKELNPDGGITAYYYDDYDRLIAVVTPENYDSALTLAEMPRTEYAYDSMDRVITQKQFLYDEETQGLASYIEKAQQYDVYGNVTKSLDALGYAAGTGASYSEKITSGYGTEYAYNLVGQPLTVLDPVSKEKNLAYTEKYTYDALGRLQAKTNASGVTTGYAYDNQGNLLSTKVKENASAPEYTLSASTYDRLSRLQSSTDGNGNTTTYAYNAFGEVRQINHPHDETIGEYIEYFQYDNLGNVKKAWDNCGKQTLYTYDNLSRAVNITAGKTDGTENITVKNVYDKAGNVRYSIDGRNFITEYVYDPMNRVTAQSIRGKITSYTYDTNGNALTQTDWLGNTNTNGYDSADRLVMQSDAYAATTARYVYNNNNAVTSAFDALGHETVFYYDKNNRLLSKTDPSGNITSQTYDNIGNIASRTDANGEATGYSYDIFSNLISVETPEADSTGYTYDLNGNLLSVTDTAGNVKSYEYNCANLLTKEIDAGGKSVSEGGAVYDSTKIEYTRYYPNGLPKLNNDRNSNAQAGQVIGAENSYGIHYGYDVHGRLASKTAISGDGTAQEIGYAYDNSGNLTQITDATGTTQMTYDFLNRMTEKTVPNTATMHFSYDLTRNLGLASGEWADSSTDYNGNVTTEVYDKNGRLSKVKADGKTTQYTYNGDGSIAQLQYENGATAQYSYTPNGLLSALANKKADGTAISAYSYTYDPAGNMLGKTDSKGETAYTYDGVNRLKTVEEPDGNVVSYTYTNGNISQKLETLGAVTEKTEYTYDANNRNTGIQVSVQDTQQSQEFALTEQYNLLYDNNGSQLQEQTTKYVNSVAQPAYVSKSYEYDGFNQMTQSVVTDESGNATTVENAYNGLGLRTVKTVNGSSTYYLHDQNDNLVLEYNAQGEKTARNIYGIGLLSRTCNNEQLYYLYNGHSDVTSMIDAFSDTKATYYYDAFGAIEESTGNVNNSTTYAGYLYDAETSLYYLNARMYNPETARFMQEDTYNGTISDPLSLNLYTYCHNEPNMHYDPSGHMGLRIVLKDKIKTSGGSANIPTYSTKESWRGGVAKTGSYTQRYRSQMESTGIFGLTKEQAWGIATGVLLVGGIALLTISCPILGAGLLGAGMAVGFKGVGEIVTEGEITGSFEEYALTGVGGFASGAIMGGTGLAAEAAGLTGLQYSVAMGAGGMAANAVDQQIVTGEIDPEQVIVSGALTFGMSEACRGVSALANNPKVQNFFKSEQGGTISLPQSSGQANTTYGGWNSWQNFAADEVGSFGLGRGARGAKLNKKLMNELAESGAKYNAADVVMITKNSDGKLLWLEKGNGSVGLKHIVDGHAANFADKGVTDIPSFLNKTLQSTPINTGTSASGPFADYLIDGNTYRVAYGSNGFIVSFYPIKLNIKY